MAPSASASAAATLAHRNLPHSHDRLGYSTILAPSARGGRIIKPIATLAPVAAGAAFVDGVAYAPYGVSSSIGGVTAYAIACPGDCNLDDRTDISELTRGVGESLGAADIADCGIFDRNGDDRITVAELVLAVRASLEGCANVES